MAVSQEEILETISSMSVMEVVDLISAMEEKFGVSAQPTVVAGGGSVESKSEEEQTEFNVIVTSSGDKKINVIKAIRSLTGLGLKEAKAAAEELPSTVKEGISKDDAQAAKTELEAAGATVEIK